MTIGPPTGMRDWLPEDTMRRQRLMETIGAVYRLYGYLPIDTPAMEDLAVLLGKGGGENEKLLFKILKRGEKLAQARESGELADYGLRFDLTVPLARFVATHQGKIPKVFRRYHIAPVWRADRPQKGRFREFYQCDIDVVGGASPAYEVEIITATERVLKELNLGNYRFRLSDKRLLPLLLEGYGVPQGQVGPLLIAFDKLDKDGSQARREIEAVLPRDSELRGRVYAFISGSWAARPHDTGRHEPMKEFARFLDPIKDPKLRAEIDGLLDGLKAISAAVLAINPKSSLVFDPILVRGMDYYTGPVYEAVVEGYPSAILGGGRYDDLIGLFTGKKIPAVGCSLGFERILAIQQQRWAGHAMAAAPRALLVCDGEDTDRLQQQAEQLRDAGVSVETYLNPDEVGKQLKYAEAVGIMWAIKRFDRVSSSLTVRHIPTRQDRTVSLRDFLTLLSVS
jgi:histidyl-tRNA synthetase